MMWIIVVLALWIPNAICSDEIDDFEFHPGAVIQKYPDISFYSHLEKVFYTVEESVEEIVPVLASCSNESPFCKYVKSNDDLSSTTIKLQNSYRSLYHDMGEQRWKESDFTTEETTQFIKEDTLIYSAPYGSDYHLSTSIIKRLENVEDGLHYLYGKARPKRDLISAAIAVGGKYAVKLAVHGVTAILGVIGAASKIQKKAKEAAAPGFRNIHEIMGNVVSVLEGQNALITKLNSVNKLADNVIKTVDGTNTKLAELNFELRVVIRNLLNMNAEIALNTQSILVQHAKSLCLSGLLPPTSVSQQQFHDNYILAEKSLPKGYEMLLNDQETHLFYTTKFSTCVIDEKKTVSGVPFMFVNKEHRFKLYTIKPIPINMGTKGMCTIDLKQTRVLFDEDSLNILPIGSSGHFSCLGSTKFCKVPQVYGSTQSESNCLVGLLTSDPFLSRECTVTCTHKHVQSFLISNEENSIYISNFKNVDIFVNNTKVSSLSGETFFGVVKITLPCLGRAEFSDISFVYHSSREFCTGFDSPEAVVVAPKFLFRDPLSPALNQIRKKSELPEALIPSEFLPNPGYFTRLSNAWHEFSSLQRINYILPYVSSFIMLALTIWTAIANLRLRNSVHREVKLASQEETLELANLLAQEILFQEEDSDQHIV